MSPHPVDEKSYIEENASLKKEAESLDEWTEEDVDAKEWAEEVVDTKEDGLAV